MIRIYYNNRPVIICGDPLKWDLSNEGLYVQSSTEILPEILKVIETCELDAYFLFSEDPQKTFEEIKALCKVISAAGGLVINPNSEILVIQRNGKWDLPKGKLEKGEDRISGAAREIQEECGIEVKIGDELLTTYHFYRHKGELILKETFWFLAEASDKLTLVPQEEEGITVVKWVGQQEIPEIYADTYANIRDILDRYRSLSSGI